MFIKRGYTASKSKSIKFDIKTCLFRERKNVSINYVCVMHELLNVFYERSKGFFLNYSIFRSDIKFLRGEYLSNPLVAYVVAYGFLPTDLVLNFKLLKWVEVIKKTVGFF